MLRVESITKRFRLYRSPSDRIKEILFRGIRHHEVAALKNVSLEVNDGETLGVIGPNGAGKSTLLKILNGVLLPDTGRITADGKITGLLELGTGFNYELTGLENIYMNGALLQMTRGEIEKKKQEIVDFTELGDFVLEPMKTYSSGMIMRLAFSVAFHADPKCFLVDEALSVGDAYFQQKCMARIRDFRQRGGSILFVSHDLNAVKMLCDHAVLLHRGEVLESGRPEEVVNRYNFLIAQSGGRENAPTFSAPDAAFGTFQARIARVSLTGDRSRSPAISSGEKAELKVEILADCDLPDLTVGIMIRDRYGQDIYGINTYHHGTKFPVRRGKRYACSFIMPMDLGPGSYTVTAALHTKDTHVEHCLHWWDHAAEFRIAGNLGTFFTGICKLHPEIHVQNLDV